MDACPRLSPIFLTAANDCTAPCRRVPRSWQVRSLQVVAAWLCAEMLQWHRHRFPPKSTCEQKQPKQIHLLWYMQCMLSSCSFDMFHSSFHQGTIGYKGNLSPAFSQVALFDTIAFLQFGRQLAPGTLEPRVKIHGLLPQHGGFENFLDDFP